jgi:spermidine synthase
LHPDPRSVAFIGVATGISTSSILDFPSVERVVTMELIPGVVDMTHYFQTANRGVLLDPRVETVVADGRNHLFGTAERFDVIVGDIFIPWHSGTAYLYTVENFQIVSDRLEPGGVFVQWFQANQLALEDLRTIVASFSDSFEHLELWLHRIDEQRPLLGLLGWKGERYGPLPTKPLPVLHKLGVPSLRPIADAEQLRSWSQSAERNTDDRPIIEFSAAQSHLGLGGAAADRANKLPFR